MASNVSNLLKEKIVTPVANSVAAQVDNKVKNGIILRKFIGVQLGESNTGCQLVKIDLNKINVKDPSYEFTLYIKAFSQKGLFNFIVNVNKTDSLQVDVKCEVKNSDSNNGEAIGYYDVDAVGNTITISLLKAFVVNTSINECKFVSTKDTLNISDLDIDWSDTGNVKNDTSIDIKGKESNIEIDVDKYLNIDCGTLGENQRYRIATIDYSKLSEAKYFDGTSGSSTGNSIGCFVRIKIASNLMGMMILEFRPLLLSIIDLSSARVILESKGMLTFSIDSDRGNIGAFLYKRENKSIQIFYNNDLFPTTSKDTIHVFSCEIISLNAKLDPDTIKVTFDMDTTIVTDTLNEIDLENDMNLYKVFTTDVNSMGGPSFNGLVPGPNKNEADNKYLLGADAKWHPRKAVNDSFIDLEPDDTIKGLDIEDATKAVSFVTFNFSNIVTKLTELSKNSTGIYFEMELETIANLSNDYHINGTFMVNKSGLIPTTVYTSPLTKIGNVNGYFDNPSVFYNEIIDTPGFYIMDSSLKTVTFALYTVFANSTVRIKDFYIHVDESVISLEDLTIEWKLLAIDKPEWVILRVQKFINGSLIPPTRIFEQMNIETPIDEADSFTLEKERVKNNGLVPAPGKYEVDNGYVLGADAKWHPRKAGNEYIANLKPTEEIKGLSETDTTKGISFVTFDFNTLSQKVVEAAPSTVQEFDINMKVLTHDLGIITISTKLGVTTAGLVACNGVLSDRGMGSRSVSFSTTYSGKLGAVTSPGFFVNDKDTKIFKIALYTPIAIDGVKIIDAVVTSYSDIINESDIVFTWELGILEKKPYQLFRSNIIYPRIALDRELVFDQMDIETPISETDEDTLFAEQIKHNGLVPAPGKYEVNNGYYLKADGTWDLPKRGNNNFISIVTPREEMTSQVSSTVGITFVTFDYSKIIESLSLAVNTGSGFEGILIINTKLFGEILINFSVSLFNLNGTINKGATAYANVGTKSIGHHSQIASIQNTYGADIKTPVFIYTDSVNNICKIGLYGSASKSPVIIKDCTLNQTYTDFDVNDIIITWEPTTITISEENTNDAPLFTNMDWSKIFTPMTNMTDPDGSYSENNIRRWKLQNNGLVPAPAKYEADQGKVLRADGTWGYQKKPLNDMLATVSPSDENIEAYNAAKETKRISFVTIDFTNVMNKVSSVWSGKLHFDVSEFNFGTTHLYLQFLVNKTMCNVNIFSTLGTNPVDDSSTISNLLDYGVETSSPIFVTNEGDSKNIIRIGFNGVSATRNISILDCYIDSPYDITIDDLVISWESSIIDTTLVNRYINSKVISYMDSGDVFSPIFDITSPSMIESTNPKTLKMYKLMNNGFVPAPYQYEADQGYVLYADGTWGPIKGIIRNRTFTVTPSTDSSSTQTNDYAITEGAEDLAIAINENYSVDINIVFSGLGNKNNTNTTLTITGVTGTVNLYDYSGNPIKYITDGMSMKCTIFKNTIDDPVESMNAYCIYDIVSYPDTINGPSE